MLPVMLRFIGRNPGMSEPLVALIFFWIQMATTRSIRIEQGKLDL